MYPNKEGELHSLFLPRLIEVREDKSEADDFTRIADQFKAAMYGREEV